MTRAAFDLSGKIALITGGSRGLGLAMARAFADHGADIIIASRKLDACEAAADDVRARGRKAWAFAAHCGRWQEIDDLIARAYSAAGRIDILVNNAGIGPAIPSPDVTEDAFDKVIGLNFKGPFRLAAQIGARMREGEGGAILNISSVASILPIPHVAPYAGAKAALNAITVSLAHEFAPKVRVNAILAGPFLTDIAKAWPEEARQRAPNALQRPGTPEEIVTSALYLVSPASSFTTGALLRVDGAMT
jgi:NAD(P)-dependent dehydrogenase (short-subunit alcohol dehydrogenase family)